jgi:hypothetical protein
MSSPAESQREFSVKLAQDFRREGYQEVDPKTLRSELPAGYIPDLIFKRGEEVTVIELKSASVHIPLQHLQYLKESIEKKQNWHFQLYVIPSSSKEPKPQENLQDANKLLSRAKKLNQIGEFEAASVILWMALETTLRTLLINRQSRPNPGISGVSMARSLMSLGELTEGEISLINQAAQLRNTSVHGFRLQPHKRLSPKILRLARNLAEKAQSEAVAAE